MDADHLAHLANRIAEFFDAMPDRSEALDGVTQHLRRYWDPRMRRGLLERWQAQGREGLHPLVADALQARGSTLLAGR